MTVGWRDKEGSLASCAGADTTDTHGFNSVAPHTVMPHCNLWCCRYPVLTPLCRYQIPSFHSWIPDICFNSTVRFCSAKKGSLASCSTADTTDTPGFNSRVRYHCTSRCTADTTDTQVLQYDTWLCRYHPIPWFLCILHALFGNPKF